MSTVTIGLLGVALLLIGGCASDDPSQQATCERGFVEQGGVCVDVDECVEGPSPCSGVAICVNRPGAYSCSCPAGWESSGTSCRLSACEYRYRQGHGDLYVSWSDTRGLSAALRSELVAGEGERLFAPAQVCIEVPRASYDEVVEFGGRPPGEVWDPLGVSEGQPFWYLPEVAIEGRPWFGLASDPGPLGGVPVDALGPELSLAVRVEAPAAATMSMWTTGETGDASFRLSTATGLLSTSAITSSHAHMSWGFTKPGEYLVHITASGQPATGGAVVSSAPQTLRFVVHE